MPQYKCATSSFGISHLCITLSLFCLRDLIEGVFKFNGIWPKFYFVGGEFKIGQIQFNLS